MLAFQKLSAMQNVTAAKDALSTRGISLPLLAKTSNGYPYRNCEILFTRLTIQPKGEVCGHSPKPLNFVDRGIMLNVRRFADTPKRRGYIAMETPLSQKALFADTPKRRGYIAYSIYSLPLFEFADTPKHRRYIANNFSKLKF